MTSSAGQDMPGQTGHPCMGQKVFADLNQKLDLWVMGQNLDAQKMDCKPPMEIE